MNEESDVSCRWDIQNKKLGIILPNGDRFVPSVDDLYALIFEEARELAGCDPSSVPSVEYLPVDATRFPARLRLKTIGRPAPSGCIALLVEAHLRDGREEVLDLMSGPVPEHVVIENCWAPINSSDIEEYQSELVRHGITDPSNLSIRQYLSLRVSPPTALEFVDAVDMETTESEVQNTDVAPGSAFVGYLYDYQKTGLSWLLAHHREGTGSLLADEMGLGKTVQLLALASIVLVEGAPVLVVAPSTIIENWARESQKFLNKVEIIVHQGPSRTGVPRTFDRAAMVVTSYDIAVQDRTILRQVQWSIVILDEAHMIRNPDARRTHAVKELRASSKIAVTGTPVHNSLVDLWSLFDCLVPGLLGTRDEFERRFPDDTTGAQEVERLVSPLLLRRLAINVASQLPDLIQIPQRLRMHAQEAAAYEAIRSRYDHTSYEHALAALQTLRQYCCHPHIIDVLTEISPERCSVKLRRLLELVSEIVSSNQKVLIFTSYVRMIDLLKETLSERFRVSIYSIDGRTENEERQPTVDAFSRCAGSSILILNPHAAGVGLNITAAEHVIHYNLEWNPAVEQQATKRAHRLGQTRPVTVHRLFYLGTVEEVIDERIRMKTDLQESAVVGVTGESVSWQELKDALLVHPRKGG